MSSQLIVPGGRPVPKKEEAKGPRVVAWADIITIDDRGVVRVTPYDSDFTTVHCQRKATPEDVIGACAYIEHEGPRTMDSIPDLSEVDAVFKTAFIMGSMPNGHVIILDDLFEPLVVTYSASTQQIFMAACVIRSRIEATMVAEITAPVTASMAAQEVMATLDAAIIRQKTNG